MLKKLVLLAVTAIFLTGCGASEPTEEAVASSVPATTTSQQLETIPSEPVTDGREQREYFVFDGSSNTRTDDDGTAVLCERKVNAEFHSADENRILWVQQILSEIGDSFDINSQNLYDYASDYIAEYGTDMFYSYSNYQQMGTARHDEVVVSLIELSSLYSGGSHPNSVQTAYNLDITNQRLLRLEDVIIEGTEGGLSTLVLGGVDEKFAVIDGMNGLFSDYADTIAGSFVYGNMTPYWYFNDRGLVIFYNQYELGPYAAGIIKVELSYDKLDGILLPEYFPARQTASGGISLENDAEHTIPITIEPEGERHLIAVEGTIHQVQILELLWLEDTPIGQNVIFSAESLCDGDVLEIIGGCEDVARSFAIQYRNHDGLQVRYIHDGKLTEEP